MKGYKKTHIRVAGITPHDHIRIGDTLYRIREYKQLILTRSTQFILEDVKNPDLSIVILSLNDSAWITVYTQK